MSRQISNYGVRLALRHPLRTAHMGNMLLGPTIRLVVITRRTAETAKRAATDPAVQAEGQRAVANATRAAQRAKQVGFAKALDDKHTLRQLRLATGHASKAASLAINPPPSKLKRTVVIVVGAGATAGAAYAGWKLYASPSKPNDLNEAGLYAAPPVTHTAPEPAEETPEDTEES